MLYEQIFLMIFHSQITVTVSLYDVDFFTPEQNLYQYLQW